VDVLVFLEILQEVESLVAKFAGVDFLLEMLFVVTL
jgi:hypothetical protein